MAKLTKINALTGEGIQTGKWFRAVLDGTGCGERYCNCSGTDFISMSDGVHTMVLNLSRHEAKELIRDMVMALDDLEEDPDEDEPLS